MKYRILILTMCMCLLLAGCSMQSQTPGPEPDVKLATAPGTVPATAATEPSTAATEPTVAEEPVIIGPTTPQELPLQTEPTLAPEEEKPISSVSIPEYLTNSHFVPVSSYVPSIFVDLKYASEDNFTGIRIYDFEDAFLRVGTLRKLVKVQQELETMGLSLKIWDAFRPVYDHKQLWSYNPNPAYISDPENGTLPHSRGNTVDVTLVNQAGEELEMPSGFDEFTAKADRNYEDCSEFAAANAEVLRSVMEKHGFTSISSEWWHFVDKDEYSVEPKFMPCEPAMYYAVCQSHINLRIKPDSSSTAILRILKDEQFLVLGHEKSFAYVLYNGMIGYVHPGYIGKV